MAARAEDDWDSKLAALRERRARYPEETQAEAAAALGVSRAWVGKRLRQMEAAGDHPLLASAGVPESRALVAVASPGKGTRDGGRQTALAGLSGIASTGALQTILPPPDEKGRWTDYGLDQKDWDRIGTQQLLKLLRRISPDYSRAVWDYLRLMNAGYDAKALNLDNDDEHTEGQEALDDFLGLLSDYYGGFKQVAGRAFSNYLFRGMLITELVLDRSGRVPVDLVVPDATIVRFRRVKDPQRGQVWQIGQIVKGEFDPLDTPTIGYVAVDSDPDNPYGTPLFTPAIFPILFLMGLLQDLRRVVAQQGYPRTDIVLKMEQVKALLTKTGDAELVALGKKMVGEIADFYTRLQPDEAFVHTDFSEVKTNGGAIATNVLQSTKPLIETLERQAMRALKSTPLMMGTDGGANESYANRQWEIFAQGINSLQQDVENNLSDRCQLALEVQGIQCRVEIRFHKVRAADDQRDEQTFKLRIENAVMARDQGFWSQEQASLHAVNEKPDQKEAPAPAPVESGGDNEDEQTDDQAEAEDGDNQDRVSSGKKRPAKNPNGQRRVPISDVDAAALDDAADEWADVFDGESVEDLLDAELRNAPEDGDGE